MNIICFRMIKWYEIFKLCTMKFGIPVYLIKKDDNKSSRTQNKYYVEVKNIQGSRLFFYSGCAVHLVVEASKCSSIYSNIAVFTVYIDR